MKTNHYIDLLSTFYADVESMLTSIDIEIGEADDGETFLSKKDAKEQFLSFKKSLIEQL